MNKLEQRLKSIERYWMDTPGQVLASDLQWLFITITEKDREIEELKEDFKAIAMKGEDSEGL